MDALARLELLAGDMRFEPAEERSLTPAPAPAGAAFTARGRGEACGPGAALAPCGQSPAELRRMADAGQLQSGSGLESKKDSLGVHQAVMPGGRRIALLKTLLTSACERDCYYCPFRAGRDYRRATFKPDEMARTFAELHRTGVAQGLFLSSGIAGGGMRTQDRLLATAEVLRHKLDYRGYLHLKIMPGAERDQVERAMQLADRVSINLEAPNPERLLQLAPQKTFFEELLRPLQWVEEIRRAQPAHQGWNGRWPSSVTQFVVGGAGESDLEILSTTERLYRDARLARAYFSAFSPVRDTPLENRPAENLLREHRLYQSSFLLRDYGFDLEELPFTPGGSLPLEADPKLAWAQAHLSEAPVEVNRAERRDLLRIPGVGPRGVEAILAARRRGRLRELRDLRALGVVAGRAAPFILLDGRRPARQLSLFV
ncbi:MAG: radical SAM protein [Chloroflexi bacterium]|nr:radical SAM protein [Chloroflexota bacterium]